MAGSRTNVGGTVYAKAPSRPDKADALPPALQARLDRLSAAYRPHFDHAVSRACSGLPPGLAHRIDGPRRSRQCPGPDPAATCRSALQARRDHTGAPRPQIVARRCKRLNARRKTRYNRRLFRQPP